MFFAYAPVPPNITCSVSYIHVLSKLHSCASDIDCVGLENIFVMQNLA